MTAITKLVIIISSANVDIKTKVRLWKAVVWPVTIYMSACY